MIVIQIVIIVEDSYYVNKPLLFWNSVQVGLDIFFFIAHNFIFNVQLGRRLFDQLGSPVFWIIMIITSTLSCIPVVIYKRVVGLFSRSIINSLRTKKSEYDLLKREYEKKLEGATMYTRSLQKFKKLYNIILNNDYEPDTYADKKMKEFILKRISRKKRINNGNKRVDGDSVKHLKFDDDKDAIDVIQRNFQNTELDKFNDALSLLEDKMLNINEQKMTKAIGDFIDKKILLNDRDIDESTDRRLKRVKVEEKENTNLDRSIQSITTDKFNLNSNKNSVNKVSLKNNLKYDKRKKLVEFKEGYKDINLNKMKSNEVRRNEDISSESSRDKYESAKVMIKVNNKNNHFSYLDKKRSSSQEYFNTGLAFKNVNSMKEEKKESKDHKNSKDSENGSYMNNANSLNNNILKGIIQDEVSVIVQDKHSVNNNINEKYKNNETIIEESTIIQDGRHESMRRFNFENANNNELINEMHFEDLEDLNKMECNVSEDDKMNINLRESDEITNTLNLSIGRKSKIINEDKNNNQ